MSTKTAGPAGPEAFYEIGMAFCKAKVLLTALELGLFTVLHEGPATERQLRDRLGLDERGAGDFLNALVGLGVLELADGRYGNTPAADRHLVPGLPGYAGGFLERSNHMLYPAWGRLSEALRTGRPQADADFRDMIEDPVRLEAFLGMMDSLSGLLAPKLAAAFDWSGHASMADIGGARGNLAGNIVRAHPHLEGNVFDLPQMEPFFEQHMRALGVEGRVAFHPGDFFVDPLPEADVLVIGHALHDWAPDERRAIVKKAFQAVAPGGALLVYDPMVDEEPSDPGNYLISLSMLLTTDGGSEYTPRECGSWMTDAGFTVASVQPLGFGDTLVVGRKDG